MIHVNVRGLLVQEIENEKQLVIQLRKREGEPEVYELPGGRINEYERIVDGLKREIKEETGLSIKSIHGEKSAIITAGDSFTMECIRPFSAYQTLEGPVDSFGIHFICEVEGELLRNIMGYFRHLSGASSTKTTYRQKDSHPTCQVHPSQKKL